MHFFLLNLYKYQYQYAVRSTQYAVRSIQDKNVPVIQY